MAELANTVLELRRLHLEPPGAAFSLQVSDWLVREGECVALVGKNGSGKSSLMEACLGLRHSRALEGRILGVDFVDWMARADLRHDVGALLQRSAPPAGLYVQDLVLMHRSLYRYSSPTVLAALGIEALSHKKFETLSRGEVQRVDLFMALAHEPRLVLLDEPFTGLDAHFSAAAADLLLARGKRAIVMCCHSASELALATRVTWIAGGIVQADAAPAELRRQLLHGYRLWARFTDAAAARYFSERHSAALVDATWHMQDDTICITSEDERTLVSARRQLDEQSLVALEFGRTTLADLLKHCAQTPSKG